ncbi:MAG: TetR/AcrR family transcriptional regulator [Peptostreptococcaceae bacterium]
MKDKKELNTKDLILKSAKEIFMSKGYDNSKTKEIALNAGVSEALLFKYFNNKENLYFQFQMNEFSVTATKVLEDLDYIESPLEALYILGKGILEPNEKIPESVRMVSDAMLLHQSKFMMTIEHSNNVINRLLVPIINKGKLCGEICDRDSIELGNIYWRFILGSLADKHHFGFETTDEHMEIILKIFR